MQTACDTLPNDIDTLKSMLADQVTCNASLTDHNTQLQTEIQRIRQQMLLLQERLHLEMARRFAARSEKCAADQIRLFDGNRSINDTLALFSLMRRSSRSKFAADRER
ncbi:MAG: hypothetical protein ABR553_07810 [Gammaproteobacteria bacterium]